MRRLLVALAALYALLLPFERSVRAFTESGTDSIFKPYRVVVLLMIAVFVAALLRGKLRFHADFGDRVFAAIFGYGVLMALVWHLIEGNQLEYTGDTLPLVLLAFAGYLILKQIALRDREIAWIMGAYAVGLFFAVLVSVSLGETGADRLRGFYKNPNQLGVAASACFVFFLSGFLFRHGASLAAQVVRAAATVGSLALLGFSGSRGSVVAAATAAVLLVYVALRHHTRRRAAARIGVFVVLLGLMGHSAIERLQDRFEESASSQRFGREQTLESAEERADLWRSGVQVGIEHYGLGVGMGQYLSHHLDSMRRINPMSDTRRVVLGTHSDYVDLFASYGALGLVGFLIYAGWLVSRLTPRAADPDGGPEGPFGLALVSVAMVASISRNSFTGPEYFFLLGIAESCARLPSGSPARSRPVPLTKALAPWGPEWNKAA